MTPDRLAVFETEHWDDNDVAEVVADVKRLEAAVERLEAVGEKYRQAIGLASTLLPLDAAIDVADPVGMMQKVVDAADRLKAELLLHKTFGIDQRERAAKIADGYGEGLGKGKVIAAAIRADGERGDG